VVSNGTSAPLPEKQFADYRDHRNVQGGHCNTLEPAAKQDRWVIVAAQRKLIMVATGRKELAHDPLPYPAMEILGFLNQTASPTGKTAL
jgi:hypothetical protein